MIAGCITDLLSTSHLLSTTGRPDSRTFAIHSPNRIIRIFAVDLPATFADTPTIAPGWLVGWWTSGLLAGCGASPSVGRRSEQP